MPTMPKPDSPQNVMLPVLTSTAGDALQQRMSDPVCQRCTPVKAVPDKLVQPGTDPASKALASVDQASAQSGSPASAAFSCPLPAAAAVATSSVLQKALSRAAPSAGVALTASALSTPDATTTAGATSPKAHTLAPARAQAPSPSALKSAPGSVALPGPGNRQASVEFLSLHTPTGTNSLQAATAPVGNSATPPAVQVLSPSVPVRASATLSATETGSPPPNGTPNPASLLDSATAAGQTTTKPTPLATGLSGWQVGGSALASSVPVLLPSTAAQSMGTPDKVYATLGVHEDRCGAAARSSAAFQATANSIAQERSAMFQSLPSPVLPAVEAIQKPVSFTMLAPFSTPFVQKVSELPAGPAAAGDSVPLTTPRPAPRVFAESSLPAGLPANLTPVAFSSAGTAFGASPAHMDTWALLSQPPTSLAPASLVPATLAPVTASAGRAFQLPAFQLPATFNSGMPAADATPPSLSFAALPASPSLFSPAQATAPAKKKPGKASKKKKKAQKHEAQAVPRQAPTPSSSKQSPASSSSAPAASAPGSASSHLPASGAAKRRPADPIPDPPNPKRHHVGPQDDPCEFVSPELTAMRNAHGWRPVPTVGAHAVQPQLRGVKSLVTNSRYMYSLPDIISAIGDFAIGHARQLEIFLGDLHNSHYHQQQVSHAEKD